ncbi:hypothetical protein [Comamonas serinivorans]|uniref:hypothetical protein n=1 Tax=Comamonas serinivorans TaxID=1082851 RepID=UPI0012F74008|nr:hypothetical protein [Comamonas serinivorans]
MTDTPRPCPPTKPESVPDHPLLARWQRLSRAGLDHSRAHRPLPALIRHDEATQVARQLLDLPVGEVVDDHRVAAFIVAHLNLAGCHVDLGQTASAAQCLQAAWQDLTHRLHDDTAPAALQGAIGRQLHHLLAAQRELPGPASRPAGSHAAVSKPPPPVEAQASRWPGRRLQ